MGVIPIKGTLAVRYGLSCEIHQGDDAIVVDGVGIILDSKGIKGNAGAAPRLFHAGPAAIDTLER